MIPVVSNKVVGRNSFETDFSDYDGVPSILESYSTSSIVDMNLTFHFERGSVIPGLVVVIADGIAKVAGNTIKKHLNLQLLGHIHGSSRFVNIFGSEDRRNLLVEVLNPPQNLIPQICILIAELSPEIFIILDSYTNGSFSSNIGGDITAITTSALSKDKVPVNINLLNVGTLIGGISAAMLNACEVRCIPAISFLALREAGYSVSSAKSFENIWPIFSLSGHRNTPLPLHSDYIYMLQQDSFMQSTELMFT